MFGLGSHCPRGDQPGGLIAAGLRGGGAWGGTQERNSPGEKDSLLVEKKSSLGLRFSVRVKGRPRILRARKGTLASDVSDSEEKHAVVGEFPGATTIWEVFPPQRAAILVLKRGALESGVIFRQGGG